MALYTRVVHPIEVFLCPNGARHPPCGFVQIWICHIQYSVAIYIYKFTYLNRPISYTVYRKKPNLYYYCNKLCNNLYILIKQGKTFILEITNHIIVICYTSYRLISVQSVFFAVTHPLRRARNWLIAARWTPLAKRTLARISPIKLSAVKSTKFPSFIRKFPKKTPLHV